MGIDVFKSHVTISDRAFELAREVVATCEKIRSAQKSSIEKIFEFSKKLYPDIEEPIEFVIGTDDSSYDDIDSLPPTEYVKELHTDDRVLRSNLYWDTAEKDCWTFMDHNREPALAAIQEQYDIGNEVEEH